jgi:hypothetical protein
VRFGKVALPSGMLAMDSVVAVAAHSAGSSATVVATSVCWVSTSEATTVASRIKGAAFTLAYVAGSFVVA